MLVHARRAFLSQLSCGLATTLVGPSGGAELSTLQRNQSRAQKALELRLAAAQAQYHAPLTRQESNGDSEQYASFLANYSKGLPHDSSGLVDPLAYQQLLKALEGGQWSDFEAIPPDGLAKLSDPIAAFSFASKDYSSHYTVVPALPRFVHNE